ncbi:MAG: EutN/CcmL family microcompartment protein [Planctomycetes bacterium]|nr:EutN/CcmL family microcompartment protein [Planctomycetota bacterium]MDA0947961.1 EutN/CcmL family microcompartment protein [Planctomycetota bacterium]
MILAQVVGTIVSTVAVEVLAGKTLLMVRPVNPDGTPTGRARIALDRVGAGVGDRVLVIDEGNSGRQITGIADAPIKTLIVGFVDSVELGGEVVFDHRELEA